MTAKDTIESWIIDLQDRVYFMAETLALNISAAIFLSFYLCY